MNEIRYLISDASKKVEVETHVLRYWEEELGVLVPRNEMGHRYYTEFHIHLFCQVKKLKDRGYQLKAIKNALQQAMKQNQGFMQAAGLLEEDMARTLWDNPYVKGREEKEVLPEGVARLADYNRLEPIKDGQASEETKNEKQKEGREGKGREKAEEMVENKPELKEKDGQTEMKKKGKNRKKPSAWERNNKIAGNEQENKIEESENIFRVRDFYETDEKEERFRQNVNVFQEGRAWQADDQEIDALQTEVPQTEMQNMDALQADVQELNAQEMDVQEVRTQKVDVQETGVQKINAQKADAQKVNIQETDMKGMAVQEREAEDTKEHDAELAKVSQGQKEDVLLISADEKMQQFQRIMTYIIGQALEANNERLSQEISRLVNECLSEELEDLMRMRDERDEERFRQFDEMIRSYQRDSQGKAEAAAARIPFFRKRRFGKRRPPQNA